MLKMMQGVKCLYQKWCPVLNRWSSLLHSAQRSHLHTSLVLTTNDLLEIHPNVASALSANKPVVALESTIITHGMPYPHNLRTAEEVECIVAKNGCTPATICVMNRKLCIGMGPLDLEQLANCSSPIKVSRRDIAWALSQGLMGGTTVSATMIGAQHAGIHVFVTGGIGGVHRDGQTSLDVSADLTELGRTPIAVISAGIKSILDIPRTLEYLETQGVTVAAYGNSREFPAFFTPCSGYQAPINVSTPREAAELIDHNLSLELGSGILLGVPIPGNLAAEGKAIEDAIQSALQEASTQDIHGKDVTPYILHRVNQITKGQSLKANIALIKNNAAVGSKIAVELSYIRSKKSKKPKQNQPIAASVTSSATSQQGRPVVIGGSNVDLVSSVKNTKIIYGDGTNAGSIHISLGGVGRNVADCLCRLDASPFFISAIGQDSQGQMLLSLSSHMDTSGISVLHNHSTSTYSCVLNSQGELVIGVADMDISSQITPTYVSQYEKELQSAPLVCIDGNIPADTIEYVCKYCSQYNIPVWYEPTCIDKSTKPFQSDCWQTLAYISPNFEELCMMGYSLGVYDQGDVHLQGTLTLKKKLEVCIEVSQRLLQDMYCVVVTLGEDGILVCRNAEPHQPFLVGSSTVRESSTKMSAVHYPACTVDPMTSVSGAGDCLAGGMIAGIIQQASPDDCILSGLCAAKYSIQSYLTVPPTVSTQLPSMTTWQPYRLL